MLIVELDGGQHEDQPAQDAARMQWLGEQGFRVLRFSDREALMETEAVLTEIQNRLWTPTPTLPQDTGEGVRKSERRVPPKTRGGCQRSECSHHNWRTQFRAYAAGSSNGSTAPLSKPRPARERRARIASISSRSLHTGSGKSVVTHPIELAE